MSVRGAGVLAFAAALACAAAPARGAVTFGAFGDTPYFFWEEAAHLALLQQLNEEPLAFVVHVGDFKSGTAACLDELYATRLEQYAVVRHPFLFLPADNEWTDCHRPLVNAKDPLERLAKLRGTFHAGDRTLGQRPMTITRQSADPRFAAYRENTRWTIDHVVFATFNIVGSNNNLGRNPEMDAEHGDRMKANYAWLAEAIAAARRPEARALVLITHASPQFHRQFVAASARDGFAAWRSRLTDMAMQLPRPILLVHGDGHRYRIDQPMRHPQTRERIRNFTRVEVFGSPETNWVRVTVTDDRPARFAIEPGRRADHGNP